MNLIIKYILPLLILIPFSKELKGQNVSEEWVPVFKEGPKSLYVDIVGLESFQGDDFYVWTMEDHNSPIVIESVRDKIYRTKTYYLFSKSRKMYGIMEFIYYDKKHNVLNSFSYRRTTDQEEYKYNYPILPKSPEELVFDICLKYVGKKSE